jgi:uncharacterized protein (DUF924 family)
MAAAPAARPPLDVLNFWFGDGAWGTEEMSSGKMNMELWWGMNPATWQPLTAEEQAAQDASCKQFAELVRAAGKGKLDEDPAWSGTAEGLYAQLLLCDQLARNCFRGTGEAFAYDERAMALARRIVTDPALFAQCQMENHFAFLTTPTQHSEKPADHALAATVVATAEAALGAENGTVQELKKSVENHMVIVDRFGRYPHRNAALGRESTPAEKEWLADTANMPAWAKSQMK